MNTPFDRTIDGPKWKSHEYKVCYTHQVVHLAYGQLFIWKSLNHLILNFERIHSHAAVSEP